MAKNLEDVMTALFEQVEKINNLSGSELDEQIKKSNTVIQLAKVMVEVGSLGLSAMKAQGDLVAAVKIPKILSLGND